MDAFDITDTLAPKSEQLDAVDLTLGERTFTVEKVSKGPADQPVNVHLADFPRPWRPGKSMRRVLAHVWGRDAQQWVGRRLTLFCDHKVQFGGQEVGGIRVRAVSHIDKPQKVLLLVSQGRSAHYPVQPLVEQQQTKPQTVTEQTLDELLGLFASKGIPEQHQLSGVNQITGGSASDLESITEQEARTVIERLQQRPDRSES